MEGQQFGSCNARLLTVVLLALFVSIALVLDPGADEVDPDHVVLSKSVYDELLLAVSAAEEAAANPPHVNFPDVSGLEGGEEVEVDNGPRCMDATCNGFDGPLQEDIPGPGSLSNVQTLSLEDCAEQCYTTPKCLSFEFSPSARDSDAIHNCQLNAAASPRQQVTYLDFRLYLRNRRARRGGGGGAPMAAQPAVCPPCPACLRPDPGVVPEGGCDIEKIRLGYDVRFEPKSQEVRGLLGSHYPTYDQIYKLVVNKDYDAQDNMFSHFESVNPYNMSNNMQFPFSNLRVDHLDSLYKMLGKNPQLIVEVGSFHGHSAILQAQYLKQRGLDNVPLVCIDPWTGDLGMLLFRNDWDKKLTPGELFDGRSTSYWQFMANVKHRIDNGEIFSKTVLPIVTTSIVAARFFFATQITPDMVYLDSAHEFDETFTELTLYFHALAPGGIVFGDDFTWEAVSHDVKKFAAKNGLEIHHLDGVTWAIQKPMV